MSENQIKIVMVEPTEEQRKLQDLFRQSDKKAILCLTKEVEELYAKIREWEECADSLVDYAHDFLVDAEQYKGYERYDRQIQMVKNHIEEYKKLKNENN
jgi:hypothetical protein